MYPFFCKATQSSNHTISDVCLKTLYHFAMIYFICIKLSYCILANYISVSQNMLDHMFTSSILIVWAFLFTISLHPSSIIFKRAPQRWKANSFKRKKYFSIISLFVWKKKYLICLDTENIAAWGLDKLVDSFRTYTT